MYHLLFCFYFYAGQQGSVLVLNPWLYVAICGCLLVFVVGFASGRLRPSHTPSPLEKNCKTLSIVGPWTLFFTLFYFLFFFLSVGATAML